MGENRKIIVVANQKGGVGKSTLSMSLANYLAQVFKTPVGGIIDMDFQQSLVKRRKADIDRIKGTESDVTPMYEVKAFDIDNHDSIPPLIEKLREMDLYYIFDTPGQLKHRGIIALLTMADYIIVPFDFSALDLQATTRFLMFYLNLKNAVKEDQNLELETKLIFVPMKRDMREGTKVEKELWEAASAGFRKYGLLTAPIKRSTEMKRCDTIRLNPLQLEMVSECYEMITGFMYGQPVDNAVDDECEYSGS